eukprot:3074433-Amphidinium_carterae.1
MPTWGIEAWKVAAFNSGASSYPQYGQAAAASFGAGTVVSHTTSFGAGKLVECIRSREVHSSLCCLEPEQWTQ